MKSQYLRENIVSMNQEEDVILEKKKRMFRKQERDLGNFFK